MDNHIVRKYECNNYITYCGKRIPKNNDWFFLDLSHAEMSVNDGKLVKPCAECMHAGVKWMNKANETYQEDTRKCSPPLHLFVQ